MQVQEREKEAFLEAAEAEAQDTPSTMRNHLAKFRQGAPRLRDRQRMTTYA
jgi:hypothetical protein